MKCEKCGCEDFLSVGGQASESYENGKVVHNSSYYVQCIRCSNVQTINYKTKVELKFKII